jgi:glutamate-1-semialdehyde aminotransferase
LDSPITQPRDLIGQLNEPLSDLQLYLRLNGVFIPWLHLAFISTAHSDDDIEEIIDVHRISVEACLSAHGVI